MRHWATQNSTSHVILSMEKVPSRLEYVAFQYSRYHDSLRPGHVHGVRKSGWGKAMSVGSFFFFFLNGQKYFIEITRDRYKRNGYKKLKASQRLDSIGSFHGVETKRWPWHITRGWSRNLKEIWCGKLIFLSIQKIPSMGNSISSWGETEPHYNTICGIRAVHHAINSYDFISALTNLNWTINCRDRQLRAALQSYSVEPHYRIPWCYSKSPK